MAEIRDVAEKNSGLQSAYVGSVKSAIDLVISRFNCLRLKEEPVCAMSACIYDDELDCLFSFAKLIDPDISWDMTTKKELSGHKKY